ncbi:hypothetical protein DFJ73DRAFT_51455 [Zopfochytrium polystomum]|nr:hypothetical protein DFJ73DRAFT_51455 [Zopfochytrium polystomum]
MANSAPRSCSRVDNGTFLVTAATAAFAKRDHQDNGVERDGRCHDDKTFAIDDHTVGRLRRQSASSPPRSICAAFYISGHGFGHSTRAYVTIASLADRGHSITIITGAPPSLFADLIAKHPSLLHLRKSAVIDPGIIQSDAVSVDSARSLQACEAYLETWQELAEDEERWLRDEKIECVLLDSPFVPAVAAKRLRLPTVLVSNFSFDAIYNGISGFDGTTAKATVLKLYRDNFDYLLRLPGAIRIPAFDSDPPNPPPNPRILNLPLVVRMARSPRDAIRRSFGIPNFAKTVLITFGGFSVTSSSESLHVGDQSHTNGQHHSDERSPPPHQVQEAQPWVPSDLLPEGWHAIIAVPGPKGDLIDSLIAARSANGGGAGGITIAPRDSYVPDLVGAVDVVAGKCGYSTCAEVVAHKVPFVYVPRPLFAEEEGLLKRMMAPFGMAVEMPHKDFYAGTWAKYILAAFDLREQGPASEIELDGGLIAAVAAENIVLTGRIV